MFGTWKEEMTHLLSRNRLLLGIGALVLLGLVVTLIAAALTARAGTRDNDDDNDETTIVGAEAEIFAEGNEFPDDFRSEYRVKFDDADDAADDSEDPVGVGSRETFERLVNDGSNVYIGSLTFQEEDEDGGIGGVDWHTHPGPFLVAVTKGELTVTWEDECKPRVYEEGEAFVDLGQRIHKAENFADEETVVHFSVVGVPEGEPITNVVADDEGFEAPC